MDTGLLNPKHKEQEHESFLRHLDRVHRHSNRHFPKPKHRKLLERRGTRQKLKDLA